MGSLVIGCAGGKVALCTIPLRMQAAPDGVFFEVSLSGLKGGHSGMGSNLANPGAPTPTSSWRVSFGRPTV